MLAIVILFDLIQMASLQIHDLFKKVTDVFVHEGFWIVTQF